MDLSVVTVFAAIVLTALASTVKDTRDALDLLAFQAASIGAVELFLALDELYTGLLVEALVDFSATFLLWVFGVAIAPAIISRGISRVGAEVDEPVVGIRRTVLVTACISAAYFVFTALSIYSPILPKHLDMLPLYLLIFSQAVFNMVVRRDPLKVLIGLNMAENAFEPLLAELPLMQLLLALLATQFVNLIALFVIDQGKMEFRNLSLNYWGKTDADR